MCIIILKEYFLFSKASLIKPWLNVKSENECDENVFFISTSVKIDLDLLADIAPCKKRQNRSHAFKEWSLFDLHDIIWRLKLILFSLYRKNATNSINNISE